VIGEAPQVASSVPHMDEVVGVIFTTMMRCRCVRVAGDAKQAATIFACVDFAKGRSYECEVMLGEEDADALVHLLTGMVDASLRDDVAGELCNMIAGGWMDRRGSATERLELFPPRTGALGRGLEGAGFSVIFSGTYSFGTGCFSVRLRCMDAH